MKNFIQVLNEIAFGGNVGFAEMVQYYQVATPAQLTKMEAVIKANDWKGFKKLIKAVLGTDLK